MKTNREMQVTVCINGFPAKEVYHGELSGKTRYRISFFGKVILQVEYYYLNIRINVGSRDNFKEVYFKGMKWRDAKQEDMKIEV